MRHRVFAVLALVFLVPLSSKAGITVEQIEAYEVDTGDNANAPTRYALLDFGGATSVTLQAGQEGGGFAGITFHALGGTTDTNSNHALAVGTGFYGDNTPAYPFVTDVYAAPSNIVLTTTTDTQPTTGIASAPGTFAPGAVVINNSYVFTTGSSASDLDLQRRLDFMIARSDSLFVSAAVSAVSSTTYEVPWSSFNSLAVSGNEQTFSVLSSQGKQHADLEINGEASFSAASASGYAAALYGTAQTAGQSDALHGVVIRSLLMAGADKTSYVRQTANNLDVDEGAGVADYPSSLSILDGGEKPLITVGTGGTIAGTPSDDQRGWSEGTVAANKQDVLLFHVDYSLTGLTASLNWDVTQSQPSAGKIDTRSSATLFADLGLEVRPVTLTGGAYVLGAVLADTTYASNATGDNVQYLYSTDSLPAGDYAFVITGDTSLSPAVGFSYALSGTFPDAFQAPGGSWATAGNWAKGLPNAAAAQVSFTGASGLSAATITLDGSKTVGQLFFSGTTNYTIASGTGGTLTINDTGDAVINPLISVTTGSHLITAPVALTDGVTASVAASSSLEISSAITGTGGITKTGTGTLVLDGANNFGNTTINAGTVTLATTASLSGGTITVNSTGSLNIVASAGSGIFVHNLGSSISLAAGGTATIAEPTAHANRQLLIAPDITFAGSTDDWSGQFQLGGNDLDLTQASLTSITNQIKQGMLASAANGILSSDVAGDTAHLTALGEIVNNDGAGNRLYGNTGTLGLFDSTSPGADDVLVKYTYLGDANLDGTVNSADLSLIDTGFTEHLTGWYNGDFNYDGVIDGSDFTLIDDAYATPGDTTPFATPATEIASTAAVPEPATLLVALLPAAALVFRKRPKAREQGDMVLFQGKKSRERNPTACHD